MSYQGEYHVWLLLAADQACFDWPPPPRFGQRIVSRAVLAFANFRLAVIEDDYDSFVGYDGFEWVSLRRQIP